MARYDKYDPKSGGFRAPLAADLAATETTGNGDPIGVGLDVNGRVVLTNGTLDIMAGVLCTTKAMKAGEIVDVMTHGEIVEMAGTAAGKVVVAPHVGGKVDDVAIGAAKTRCGYTVEATRLIVRMASIPGV